MGYISLQFTKVKGTSDTRMSDHIERKTIPSNADPTRTHLNRELIGEANEVRNRDHAITERIQSAGIKRKITPNQVRAIRIMLSGTHEDMMQVQQSGQLNEWCNDNLQWLYKEFGRENTVSAVLHMDEHTPHIHATVIPIVKGERRKGSREKQDGKKKYRKKSTDTTRLCADDVLTRDKMIAYHNSYSAIMGKYGLQRGERGSEARHVTTAQYYRNIQRDKKEIESEVQQLKEERADTEKQLKQVKEEVGTEKKKAAKEEAKAVAYARMGSLFGKGKITDLEQENKQLYEEVSIRDESIEKLQAKIQEQQNQHHRQMLTVQGKHIVEQNERNKEVSVLKKWIDKACKWFPLFADVFRIEKLCHSVGFTPEQTERLLMLKPLEYSGTLYSEEHNRKFAATQVLARIVVNPTDNRKFALHINGRGLSEWFKEQIDKFCQTIRQPIQPQKKSKGFKL